MKEIEAYPLQWPMGRPRRPANQRQRARFSKVVKGNDSPGSSDRRSELSVYAATERLKKQVERLRGSSLVVSTNIKVRQDGLPMSRAAMPEDPAVCVYFVWRGKTRAFPSDKWDRVADNIAAIAAHLEAMRAIERYAVGETEQVFEGYKLLTSADASKVWWEILGFPNPPANWATVESRWLDKIRRAHPDAGGSANQAAEINAAYDQAKAWWVANR